MIRKSISIMLVMLFVLSMPAAALAASSSTPTFKTDSEYIDYVTSYEYLTDKIPQVRSKLVDVKSMSEARVAEFSETAMASRVGIDDEAVPVTYTYKGLNGEDLNVDVFDDGSYLTYGATRALSYGATGGSMSGNEKVGITVYLDNIYVFSGRMEFKVDVNSTKITDAYDQDADSGLSPLTIGACFGSQKCFVYGSRESYYEVYVNTRMDPDDAFERTMYYGLIAGFSGAYSVTVSYYSAFV